MLFRSELAKVDRTEFVNPIGDAEPIIPDSMMQPVELVMGDVDSDGQFNESDIQQLGRYFENGEDVACLAAADFNDDGKVTLEDQLQAVQLTFATANGLALETSFTYREGSAGTLPCNYAACP